MNRKKTLQRLAKKTGVTVKDMFKYPIQNTLAAIIAMGGSKEKIRAAFTQLGTICDEHTKLLEMMAQAQSERDALKLSVSDLTDANKTLHGLSNEFRTRYDALRSFLEEFHPENLKEFDGWQETQKALKESENVFYGGGNGSSDAPAFRPLTPEQLPHEHQFKDVPDKVNTMRCTVSGCDTEQEVNILKDILDEKAKQEITG